MSSAPSPMTPLVALGRVFWMMVGPTLLAVLVFAIINVGTSWFTPVDIAFLIVLGLMVAVRWAELQAENPRNAAGDPASPGDFRRYAFTILPIGIAAWIVANLIGNHWPAS